MTSHINVSLDPDADHTDEEGDLGLTKWKLAVVLSAPLLDIRAHLVACRTCFSYIVLLD